MSGESEYERTFREWEESKRKAYEATGKAPIVCLMGSDTYFAFLTCIRIRMGLDVPCESRWQGWRCGPFEYNGIAIYPCFHEQRGYWFGSMDNEGGFC
jgi:hypothetical protein